NRLEIGGIGVLEPGRIAASRRLQLAYDAGDTAGDRVERDRRQRRLRDHEVEWLDGIDCNQRRDVVEPEVIALVEKGVPLIAGAVGTGQMQDAMVRLAGHLPTR